MPLFPVVSDSNLDADGEGAEKLSWQRSRTAHSAAPATSAPLDVTSSSSSRKRESSLSTTRAEESRSDGKRRRHRSPPPGKPARHGGHTTAPSLAPATDAFTSSRVAGSGRGTSSTAATTTTAAAAADGGWFVDSGGDGKNIQFESLYKGDVVIYRRSTDACLTRRGTVNVTFGDGRSRKPPRGADQQVQHKSSRCIAAHTR